MEGLDYVERGALLKTREISIDRSRDIASISFFESAVPMGSRGLLRLP